MKKKNQLLKALLLMLLWTCPMWVRAQQPVEVAGASKANYRGEYKHGEVIVKFRDDKGITVRTAQGKRLKTTSVSQLDKALANLGLTTAEQLMPLTGAKKLNKSNAPRRGPAGKIIPDPDLSRLFVMTFEETEENNMKHVIEQLKQLDEVEYAYPNYYVYAQSFDAKYYNDEPMRSQQWYLDAINLPKLWEQPMLDGAKRPVIAILDTGVDIEHPDLADNIWTNEREAAGADYEDDDNNGFVDDVHGWNFVQHNNKIEDRNGHGTHCAGIAAAVGNNGVGITGANPDAIIMPITVMQPDGVGTLSLMAQGVDYAIANGADILSMSFGYSGGGMKGVFQKAYQTSILVASAGNNNASLYGGGDIYPAAFDIVLGVQASNKQNEKASFSNYDPDGPYFVNPDWMQYPEDWFNYEVWAPGQNILSTYPGGTYKIMSGTSMATPLVAGAVSRLLQTKEMETYRDVWIGDIIEGKAEEQTISFDDYRHGTEYRTGIIDVYKAYCYNEDNRNVRLSIVEVQIDDSKQGDGDGHFDAGEVIELYPVLRSGWGPAQNIKLSVMANPSYESASNIEIIQNDVDFGYHLNSIGSMRSQNPLIIKVADKVEDGHALKLRITATCDNLISDVIQDVHYNVENGVEIGGFIEKDLTLYPNVHYIVTSDLAIPKGVSLTILPGTRLEFYDYTGILSEGHIIANGTPELPIVFTPANSTRFENLYSGGHGWDGIQYNRSYVDTLSYCIIENAVSPASYQPFLVDCIVKPTYGFTNQGASRCNFVGDAVYERGMSRIDNIWNSNIVNFMWRHGDGCTYSQLRFNNYFNNFMGYMNGLEGYLLGRNIGAKLDHSDNPSYLGSGKEEAVRKRLLEIGNAPETFTKIDLSNMPKRPYREAHGIVWKVVVDGYDAQDEFDLLPPLGVGRHEFKVFFNREQMDTTSTPVITMGLREPYTQTAIAEDGKWSVEDSAAVYTAYLNITGKLQADGLNRIRVTGAKDDEFFDVPDEYWRFNVLVQAVGSMATGFAAEAGLGNVKLTWNNEHNDFEDAMGFNVYRFRLSEEGDTIGMTRLNEMIIDLEDTEYTDYEVTPGVTYYYYYKVLSTDLKEYDISNVVAATPLTSTLGDANASGHVDVADVITTVNYAAGMEPRPFIFEAADVNADNEIDILDVIGIIKIITRPNDAATAGVEAVAEYTVEDGVVYVDCPVDLAGVQLTLAADRDAEITATAHLRGFEQVGAWLGERDYLFLAYNLNGRTLTAGRHAILNIGNHEIADVRLSDKDGHNVQAVKAVPTVIEVVGADARPAQQGVYDLMGRKVAADAAALPRLAGGIYVVNGKKVVVR
ncbi:MAG: S8 family serine peptidase [Muribaculaceae bacterium]|nr:S8 family serine peptidase [Muribaculaceae bacterium]